MLVLHVDLLLEALLLQPEPEILPLLLVVEIDIDPVQKQLTPESWRSS